jgi:hypothetical protein
VVGERVPRKRGTLIGIYIHTNDSSSSPEMNGVKKIPWTWEAIWQFLDSL